MSDIMFVHIWTKCTLAYHETLFSEVFQLEVKGKGVCEVYIYFEEQLDKSEITISPLSHVMKSAEFGWTMVVQIICEKRRPREDEEFTTPTKCYRYTWKRLYVAFFVLFIMLFFCWKATRIVKFLVAD